MNTNNYVECHIGSIAWVKSLAIQQDLKSSEKIMCFPYKFLNCWDSLMASSTGDAAL